MDWHDHITVDPGVLAGKPVVKGTRIAVEMVIDLLAAGWTQQQILDSYPTLNTEGVRAVWHTRARSYIVEKVSPLKTA